MPPSSADDHRAHTIATATKQQEQQLPSASSGQAATRNVSLGSTGSRPSALPSGAPSPALRRVGSAIKRRNSGVFAVDKHAVSLTLSTASIAPQNKPAGGSGLPGAALRFSGRAADSGRHSASYHSRPTASPHNGSVTDGPWASGRSHEPNEAQPPLSPGVPQPQRLEFDTEPDSKTPAAVPPPSSRTSGRESSARLSQRSTSASIGLPKSPKGVVTNGNSPHRQVSRLGASTHPYLRSLYAYDARGTDIQQLRLGHTSGQWLFGHRREALSAQALQLNHSSKFTLRFARMREFRRLMTKAEGKAAPGAAAADAPRPASRVTSRRALRDDTSTSALGSTSSLGGTYIGAGAAAGAGADSVSLSVHGLELGSLTTALSESPPAVAVPGPLRPLISAPDAPPFGGPLLPGDISATYYAEDQHDPLDSARSELAVDMSRVALEALASNMQFVVSNEIIGSFDERATPAKSPSKKELEAGTAERHHAPAAASRDVTSSSTATDKHAAKPRYVSKAEERAAKRAAKKEARRLRALERERAREAEERRLMQAEEWEQQRAIWWKGRSLESSWRTVRVFVSSTFNDFHGERDALTRVVFPALNNRAKSRRVRVVPVDLRWGLTAEDTSDSGLGALEHCLLEIETSRPFFMALLGERYGWIPPNYRVSETKEFQWVKSFEDGHSITAMEIYHGFLRKPYTPVHALVYNRGKEFIEDIPDTKNEQGWSRRGVFAWDYPGQDNVLQRRNQLRQDCADHPYSKYRTYTTQYGGEDEEGKPTVTGLAEFESMVLEDLWEAVKAEFPPPPPPPSELAVERAYHLHFVENRSQNFIGRRKLLKTLEGVADQDNKGATLPFVVVGAPGSGKTSLVTAFAKQYMMSGRNCFVLVHVVSASPSSTDIREVLLRLCHEFAERFDLPRAAALDENDDYQKIKETYADTLIEAGKCAKRQGGHVLLVIDAINQLNTFYGAHTMDWCPPYSPPGVITLLSATPDSPPLIALMKRDPQPQQLNVPGLQLEDRQEIVRKSLLEYSKRLKPDQMDLIMQKPESTKPLYLLTVCEELRLQAQYGEAGSGVDSKIRELPGEIPDLLHVVLLRVERDLSTWAEHAGGAELAPAAITVGGSGDGAAASGTAIIPVEGGDEKAKAAARAAQLAVSKAAAERVGYFIVRDALSLLVCSRHGLSEDELLEMLAPPGKAQLPPVVWARLYRSLELYLRPVGDDAQGLLGFFHEQMVFAVQRRYLAANARMATAVSARLLDYFSTKADPHSDLQYRTSDLRYVQDMVYYQLRAHRYADLYRTLGCIQFIQRRASNGPGSMEHLLRDYHDAMEDLRTVRYSAMKDGMAATSTGPGTSSVLAGQGSALSEQDGAGGASRAQLLQWVGEFLVFVGSAHAMMVEYPWLTFQQACNQPTLSAPALVARDLLERDCALLVQEMEHRTQTIKDIARAEFERLVEPILSQLAPPPAGSVSPNTLPDANSTGMSPTSARTGTVDSVTSRGDDSPASRSASGRSLPTGHSKAEAIKTELALATRVTTATAPMQLMPPPGVGPAGKKPSSALSLLQSPQAAGIRRRLQRLAGATAWALRRVANGLQPKHAPRRHLVWCNKPRRNLIVADFAGYTSKVTAISLSPDDEHIAIGFQDGTLNIVDAGTGEIVRECSIGGHSDGITCLQYSSDGLRLVSGSFDCQVIIWDALTGTRLSGLDDHEDVITAVTWLDPEPTASTSTGARRSRKSVAVKGGARMLATASMDCTVVIWEEARGGRYGSYSRSSSTTERAQRRERKRQEREASGGTAFSGDQLRYDVIYEDVLPERPVLSVAYDPVFKTLFLGMMRDGDIMMLDATAPSLGVLSAGKFTAHKYVRGVTAIAVSPDGRTLCTSSNSTPNTSSDHSLKLWSRSMSSTGDIQWEERPVSGADHAKVITAVDFSATGTHFMSCSMDKKLFIYDAESGQQVMTLTGHADSVYCASFMHRKLRVVSGSHDKSVKVWSLSGAEESTKRTEVKKASHQGHRALPSLAGVGTVDASMPPPSGPTPGSTRGDRLDKRRQSLMSQNMPLAALSGGAASRRKTMLPSGGDQADKLAPIDDAPAQTHDMSTRVRVVSGSHADRVTVSLVSADGCVAITGSADKTLKVWDIVDDGRDALTLVGHNAAVTSLYLSPDRRLLVSGDADGNLLLWSGLTFDHFHSIHAHSEKRITSITAVDIVRVPGNVRTPNVSTGMVVFSGAEDGSIKAWRAYDGRPWEIKPPPTLHSQDFPIMAMQFVAAATLPMPPAAQPAPINSGLLQPHHLDPTLSITPQAGVLPGRGLAPIGAAPPSPAASFRSTGQPSAFTFSMGGEAAAQPAVPGGISAESGPEDTLPECFAVRSPTDDDDGAGTGPTGMEIAAAAAAAAAMDSREASTGKPSRPRELRPQAGYRPTALAEAAITDAVLPQGLAGSAASQPSAQDRRAHQALRGMFPIVASKLPVETLESSFGPLLPSADVGGDDDSVSGGRTPSNDGRRRRARGKTSKSSGVESGDKMLPSLLGRLLVPQRLVATQPRAWDDGPMLQSGEDPLALVPGWTPPGKAAGGSALGIAGGKLSQMEVRPDRIFSMGGDGHCVVWDLFRGTVLHTYSVPHRCMGVGMAAAAVAPSAARVAVAPAYTDVTARVSVMPGGNLDLAAPVPLDALDTLKAVRVVREDSDRTGFDASAADVPSAKPVSAPSPPGGGRDELEGGLTMGSTKRLAGGVPITVSDIATAKKREMKRLSAMREQNIAKRSGAKQPKRSVSNLSTGEDTSSDKEEQQQPQFQVLGEGGPMTPLLKYNGGVQMYKRESSKAKRAAANKFGRFAATESEEAAAAAERLMNSALAKYEAKKERQRRREERAAEKRRRAAARARKGSPGDEDDDDDDLSDDGDSDEEDPTEGSRVDGSAAGDVGEDDLGDVDEEWLHKVSALAFSSDGTLLATGTEERLVTISDPSRPHLGPLAQFVTTSGVTAIGAGPGVLPWAEPAEDVPQAQRQVPALAGVHPRLASAAHTVAAAAAPGGGVTGGAGKVLLPPSSPINSGSTSLATSNAVGGAAATVYQQFRDLSSSAPDLRDLLAPGAYVSGLKRLSSSMIAHTTEHARRSAGTPSATPGTAKTTPLATPHVKVPPPQGMDRQANEAVFQSMKTLTEHTLRQKRPGDGNGCLGVVVAGDSTGQVFILKLHDSVRTAEAARDAAVVQRELEAAQAAHGAMLASEALTLHGDSPDAGTDGSDATAALSDGLSPEERMVLSTPISQVHFDNGRTGDIVSLPRRLHRDTEDELLVENVLKRLGMQVDELSPDPIPLGHSLELMAALPLRPAERGQGLQALYAAKNVKVPPGGGESDAQLLPFAQAIEAAARARGVRLVASEPRSTRAKRRPGQPPGRPAPGKPARPLPPDAPPSEAAIAAAIAAPAEPPQPSPFGKGIPRRPEELLPSGSLRIQALRARYFARPTALVCVFGGAGGLHDLLVPRLRGLIKRGATVAAMAVGGMVLDGGTDAGVMSMIGQGLEGIHRDALRVLGVSPAGLVYHPTRKQPLPQLDLIGEQLGDDARREAQEALQKLRAARKGRGKRSPSAKGGAAGSLGGAASAADSDEDDDDEEEGDEFGDDGEGGAAEVDPNKAPLEPHHSHFFLAPTDEWGGETSTMFTVTCVLRRRLPTVAVLANGGFISMKEIHTCVALSIPVIAIEGSGRLADKIAQAMSDRKAMSDAEWEAAKAGVDEDVLDIIQGDITLFPVTGSAPALQDIILEKLQAQRDQMMADRTERKGVTVAPEGEAAAAEAGGAKAAPKQLPGPPPPPRKRPGMSIKIEGGNLE